MNISKAAKIGSGALALAIGIYLFWNGFDHLNEASFNQGWLDAHPDGPFRHGELLVDGGSTDISEQKAWIASERASAINEIHRERLQAYYTFGVGAAYSGAGIWQMARR
jgi:hypothetical protein